MHYESMACGNCVSNSKRLCADAPLTSCSTPAAPWMASAHCFPPGHHDDDDDHGDDHVHNDDHDDDHDGGGGDCHSKV